MFSLQRIDAAFSSVAIGVLIVTVCSAYCVIPQLTKTSSRQSFPVPSISLKLREKYFDVDFNAEDAVDHAISTRPSNNTVAMMMMMMERKHFLKGSITAFSAAAVTIGGYHQPSWGTTIDPKTGIRLPDLGEIETSIPDNWSDEENPISSSDNNNNKNTMFSRLDNKPDSIFYQDPRFVEHVDDNAVKLMTEYISNTAIQPGRDKTILDLCSSWTSHIDDDVARKLTRISGLGMNNKELESNPTLTDWIVQDLNENPNLSKYENESFDVVLLQLSIDYLIKPLEVLKEVGRILKVGGKVHIVFSNRLFLSKAVGFWTGGDDIDHAYYVGSYLHFCDGGFQDIQAKDLSTRKGGRDKRIIGDPMFVVTATKG
jgi:SAM-dependent methyltransferase